MRWDGMRWDQRRWKEIRSDEMRSEEMRGNEMRRDKIRRDQRKWDEMRVDEIRGDENRWNENRGDYMRWDQRKWNEMRWDQFRLYSEMWCSRIDPSRRCTCHRAAIGEVKLFERIQSGFYTSGRSRQKGSIRMSILAQMWTRFHSKSPSIFRREREGRDFWVHISYWRTNVGYNNHFR